MKTVTTNNGTGKYILINGAGYRKENLSFMVWGSTISVYHLQDTVIMDRVSYDLIYADGSLLSGASSSAQYAALMTFGGQLLN